MVFICWSKPRIIQINWRF